MSLTWGDEELVDTEDFRVSAATAALAVPGASKGLLTLGDL